MLFLLSLSVRSYLCRHFLEESPSVVFRYGNPSFFRRRVRPYVRTSCLHLDVTQKPYQDSPDSDPLSQPGPRPPSPAPALSPRTGDAFFGQEFALSRKRLFERKTKNSLPSWLPPDPIFVSIPILRPILLAFRPVGRSVDRLLEKAGQFESPERVEMEKSEMFRYKK